MLTQPEIIWQAKFALRGLFLCTLTVFFTGCYATLPEPTEHYVRTEDGWTLNLRHFPAGAGLTPETRLLPVRNPVICCHGLSYNMEFWSIAPEVNFPRYLQERGVSCWTVSLRGSGRSTKPALSQLRTLFKLNVSQLDPMAAYERGGSGLYALNWDIDDHINKDIPTIVRYVMEQEKAMKVHWVGHSMGGMIILANMQTKHSVAHRLASVTSVGGNMVSFHPLPPVLENMASDPLGPQFVNLSGAFNMATIVGVMAGPIGTPTEQLFMNPDNMDPLVMRLIYQQANDDVGPGQLGQMLEMFRNGSFRSADGKINYAIGLRTLNKVPAFFMGAPLDYLAQPAAMQWAYRQYAGPKQYELFAKVNGFKADYGHDDMVVGKHARTDTYPRMHQFLSAAEQGHLPPVPSAEMGTVNEPMELLTTVTSQPATSPDKK